MRELIVNWSAYRGHRVSQTRRQILGVLIAACLVAISATHTYAAESPAIDGVTQPFLDVTLSAPVPGIISAEFFKEGQAVKKGDVILELDKRLEELEVDRRKAVMDQAKKDLDSSRILVSTTKSVSKEELQKKETDYAVAAAEYGIAAEQLARRKVIAPFDGSISEITLQVGAASSPYQSLVRLVDTTRGYFVGQVEARALAGLHMDQSVRIQMDGVPDSIQARISFISPVVDAGSGLAKVKALFDNPDAKIRPGVAAKMFVE